MFRTFTLENGVRVCFEAMPFVRSVSLGLWVRNGSRNETRHNNGISHFIEHMLFKGTESRSAKDIADEMDAIGGQINAYTSKEYTCYYTRTLDEHFDIALDVLADMFFRSRFDQTDIDKERQVIFEEISMYEDSPDELVNDLLQLNVWKDDSLGYSILGTSDSISSLDTLTFKNYFKENYTPQNLVIAVAGNFREDEVLCKLQKHFSGFAPAVKPSSGQTKSVYHVADVKKSKGIEQLHISLGFPSIPIGSDDAHALAIINTVLGGGMSSRLFQKIREDYGLVYSIYSYNVSYTNTGLFTIYAGLNPSQKDRVMSLILDEVRLLKKDGVDKQTLQRTKDQLIANYLMSLESSSSRMTSMGRALLMLDRILTPDGIVEKINAVTVDNVYSLGERIFDLDAMSSSMVGP